MAGNRRSNSNHPRKLRVKKEPFSFKRLDATSKKRVKWGAIALSALVVILIVLASLDLLPHFDGSMHVVAGKLRGAGENDIVINKGSSSDKKYFNIGSLDMPEGYTNDSSYEVKTDENESEWCFRPTDKNSKIEFVLVCGCSKSWDEMIGNILSGGYASAEVEVTEQIDAYSPVNQTEYHGCITTYLAPDPQTSMYSKYYTAYVPTDVKGTCVMVYVNSKSKKVDNLPTDDEIRAVMESMVDLLRVGEGA